MVAIAITGANIGLGYETSRQLAGVSSVTKVILTCRSKEKAEKAIDSLVAQTGKVRAFFDYVVVDLADLTSIKAAAEQFPHIDRIILNAGGLGHPNEIHEESGATHTMVINTLGHAVLVDLLLKANKISKGGRVAYIGSEVSRTVWSFYGLLPHYHGYFAEKDIDWAIGTNYNLCCACIPVRTQLGDYKNSKLIGQLHFAHMAKEHPDILWVSTSPGAVAGAADPESIGSTVSFATRGKFPLGMFMGAMPWLFRCLGVTHAYSPKDCVKIGAKRYVDVITGEPSAWESGAMPMSEPACGCIFWGANGNMVDQRAFFSYLNNPELNQATAAKIREYEATWSTKTGISLEPGAAQDMQNSV